MRSFVVIMVLIVLASVATGVFILNQENKIVVENISPISETTTSSISGGSTSEILNQEVEPPNISTSTEENVKNLIAQAQQLISEAQKFVDEQRAVSSSTAQALEKSSHVKGVYLGSMRSFDSFKDILDQTELNGVVIDIKETYGMNLSASLKNSIADFHQREIWAIARIVIFRDSSLVQEKPEWYLTFASTTQSVNTTSEVTATSTSEVNTTSTNMIWQDNAGQYWLDPQNEEVRDYIIEFSKRAIDFGFDELQFDYIRYPDDYESISGQEKIKVIGDFFAKLSDSLKAYKPSVILSADLFGYVATQFNSFGTGQRLFDAGKYFDYLSFMLYPSHFYGGFASKGIVYTYPEVVSHPYDIIYYSVFSARDYLSQFNSQTKIRPWLQNFDLKADRDRGVFYDAEKIRLQIEGAENATSSGWLLWNPSYNYTEEALLK